MIDGGQQVRLEPGFIARVGAGVVYALTGKVPGWMGPGMPITPVLTPEIQEEVKGRQFDYNTGQNFNYQPGNTKGVSFNTLRTIGDSLDILRLVIETRKDQMENQTFSIQVKGGGGDAGDRGKRIEEFLQMPDRVHTWAQWQRALLEDHFVIDAPVIYPRRTLGGQPFSLDLLAGDYINILVDQQGRRPAQGPAYQQILKGVIAAEFEAKELIYGMSNWRTNRLYGYSRVEQVIVTVNIALRRQLHQLQMYTEGATPDMIFSVPSTWSPDQIKMFETQWNNILAGNTGERRRAHFVPDGVKPINTKEGLLSDPFDEWLARIICFCFSISPQAFVKMMNRSTSDTAQETAITEGLFPIQKWLKGILDRILSDFFDAPDLKIVWENEKEVDIKVRAEVSKTYLECNALQLNEVREDMGRDPYTEEELARIAGTSADALEGQQITALQGLVQTVADSKLPASAAKAVISASFPKLAEKTIDAMLQGLESFQPTPPDAGNLPPNAPEGIPTPQGGANVDGGAGKPALSGNPAAEAGSGDAPAKAAGSRLGKSAAFVNPNRKAVVVARKKFTAKLKKVFRHDNGFAIRIHEGGALATEKMAKTSPNVEILEGLLKELLANGFEPLGLDAEALYQTIFEDGAEEAVKLIIAAITKSDASVSTDLIHTKAVEWAQNRAAKLIVDIEQTTMERIRADVTEALSEGQYTEDLADKLVDSYGFSDARAEMISRTELAAADSAGNMAAYRESGVVEMKSWLRADAADDCDICQGNEDDGDIPIGQAFSSGDDAPPGHPNCLCVVVPVVNSTEE
jgi:hypothetical protein